MSSSSVLNTSSHGSGDSYVITNVFPEDTANKFFHHLLEETNWQEMKQKGGVVPRGVSIQGTLLQINDDTHEPVYRHPVDEQPMLVPWTATSDVIRQKIEQITGQSLNHGLIQFYKNGFDFIGEHSDKTLDVLRNSKIFNFSLGATRTMILKRKADSKRERIKLKHNSLFVLGWKTNREWFHSVKQDRRMDSEKTEDEMAFGGRRISLTLRSVATFRSLGAGGLHGQGAVAKTFDELNMRRDCSKVDDEKDMLYAFAAGNKMSLDFDWDVFYGKGFDALNFKIFNNDCDNESNL